MSHAITYDKEFKGIKTIAPGEYENCTFVNCDLANTDLSNISFTDCEFKNCDMSMAKVNQTAFRTVGFENCKLLGLRFGACNPFLLNFTFNSCVLNYSSFYQLKLKNFYLQNCKLEEVEFIKTDLTNARLINCDFDRAVFENTVLNKADLRTSYNYSINPEFNQRSRTKFSLASVPGLLDKYDIIIE